MKSASSASSSHAPAHHIWLGWIVGFPMLFWTLSGVIMVWKPIEEVRGEHLLAEPAPIGLDYCSGPPASARVAASIA